MFVHSSKPFQLSSYKKENIPNELKAKLMTSYTCVMCPYVILAGAVFEKKVLLCKKVNDNKLIINENTFKITPVNMNLQNLIENFRVSEGIDFLILDLNPYFLLTRQNNDKINVFMTTAPDYLKMFADPANEFGNHPQNVYSCDNLFNLKEMKSKKVQRIKEKGFNSTNKPTTSLQTSSLNSKTNGDDSLSKNLNEMQPTAKNQDDVSNDKNNNFTIQIGNPLTDEEFENHLSSNPDLISIKYGNLIDGVINFTRQPLKKLNNNKLADLIDYFTYETFDYVEILGNTKFMGYRRSEGFIWFAELPSTFKSEYLYIDEISKIMSDFTISIEDKK